MSDLPGLPENPVADANREDSQVPGYDDELLAEIRMLGDLVARAGASSEFLPRAVVDATLEITHPSDGHTSDALLRDNAHTAPTAGPTAKPRPQLSPEAPDAHAASHGKVAADATEGPVAT